MINYKSIDTFSNLLELLLLFTSWFVQRRDGNRAAAINSHRVSNSNFHQWSSADPVLNESNNLGAIKVIRTQESISIDHFIRRTFTDELVFIQKVGEWKVAFTVTLDSFDKSSFDKVTVQLCFVRTLHVSS